ncbi:RecBCD enzyme subunit RecD [Acrasis kona]|uniref:RecBCD enzyme subunit RecD n=1 Tax=Acrasis kona TaxID=1008807 RepID=A0AAW2YV13_9EUKA
MDSLPSSDYYTDDINNADVGRIRVQNIPDDIYKKMDKGTANKVLTEIRNRESDEWSALTYLLPMFLLKPFNPYKERNPYSFKIIQRICRYRPIPYNSATRFGFYSLLFLVYMEVQRSRFTGKTDDGFLKREGLKIITERPIYAQSNLGSNMKDLYDYDIEQRLKFYNDLIEKQRNGLLKSKIDFSALFDVNNDKQKPVRNKDIKQEEEEIID